MASGQPLVDRLGPFTNKICNPTCITAKTVKTQQGTNWFGSQLNVERAGLVSQEPKNILVRVDFTKISWAQQHRWALGAGETNGDVWS